MCAATVIGMGAGGGKKRWNLNRQYIGTCVDKTGAEPSGALNAGSGRRLGDLAGGESPSLPLRNGSNQST
jgi:hypothetical protein